MLRKSQFKFLGLVALSACVFLTGCASVSDLSSAPAPQNRALSHIFGGQQPVSGAQVYLLAMGESGLASTATSMLIPGSPGVAKDQEGRGYVTSAADGSFSVSGDYLACADPANQVYLLATGGNPGLSAGTNNAALTLGASIGTCGSLSPVSAFDVDERSTVALASAFAAYASNPWSIGAPANLDGAMSDAAAAASELAPTSAGTVYQGFGADVVPVAALNTLADALAACVNTGSPGSSACAAITSATGATDTLSAAIYLSQNPAASIPAIFQLVRADAPFQPTLPQAPADWTLAPRIAPQIQTTSGVIELGDSITTILTGNGASPETDGYGQLLANYLGTPFNNGVGPDVGYYSQGGDESIDSANKAWMYGMQPSSGDPPVTLMIGTNDVYYADPSATVPGHEQVYRDTILADMTLWLTPAANKLFPYGNSACAGPGWMFDGSFPGAVNGYGLYTTTVGAPLTCSYTTYGGPIYLWHLVDGLAGVANVTVDGVLCGTYSTTYPGYGRSYNGTLITVSALRCPVAAGTHTVAVVMTSGVQLGFDGLGTPSVPSASAPPRLYAFGPLHQASDQSSVATFLYAKLLENTAAQLVADGYPVQYINIRDHVLYTGALDPDSTGAPGSSCMANELHPADCGHAQIAAGLEAVIPQ